MKESVLFSLNPFSKKKKEKYNENENFSFILFFNTPSIYPFSFGDTEIVSTKRSIDTFTEILSALPLSA